MFRLTTVGPKEFFRDILMGTPTGALPCDHCGEALELHARLVVEVEERRGARRGRVVACDRKPRVWRMWARRQENLPPGRDFRCFGQEHGVRRPWMGSGEPTEVVLTEDPEGTYWGWIDCRPEQGHNGEPVMIEPHESLFRMKEPGGFHGRVAEGRGEVVRLTVRTVQSG